MDVNNSNSQPHAPPQGFIPLLYKNDGLGGIRTRGLYVANVTIYP